MTNQKKLIKVTVSLDRNCLSFHKRKGILKIDQSLKFHDISLVWELHARIHRLLVYGLKPNKALRGFYRNRACG